MITVILFDCFGVLYPNSSGDFFEHHKDLFKDHPEIMGSLNTMIDLGEISRHDFFIGLEAATGVPADEIQREFDVEQSPDPKLLALISQLKQKYKIGLLSNAGREEIEIIYRDKIADLFDVTTVSYEAKAVKPSPQIFITCLNRLAVTPSEVLFVDDSIVNIRAASKLGITTLHYPKFGVIPTQLVELLK